MKTKSSSLAKPLPTLKKQVGIWIRVSTEEQAEGDSPKIHQMRARAYAESRDWTVREVYDLSGVSGKTVAEHREAKRMLEDVRRGHIQGLVFSKLARLARNTRELLDFADFFQKHDADLISLQENIDTGTPSGRLFYTMIAAMAQWEREEINDRQRASIAVRAKLGKPLNGKPVFGYQFDKALNKIVPHPDEAPVRKLIYELFAEHKRKGTVANALNERGFRNRKGTRFSRNGVEYLLRDPTAKGEYRSNYTYLSDDKKKLLYKPEHEWVINPVEPIVSKELWAQCNAILDNRKAALERRPGPRVVHPFAGLITCQCGETMYVKSNTPKYVCRQCRNKLPVETMDAIFREHLTGYMLSPERLAAYLNSANKYEADAKALLDTLNADLRRVKDEDEKMFQLYYAGGITADQFKVRYAPVQVRREQLEKEIAQTEARLTVAKVDSLSTEQIVADAQGLYNRWPSMTQQEKRNVVEPLVRQILVRNGEVEIDFIYLPFFEDMEKEAQAPSLATTQAIFPEQADTFFFRAERSSH